VAWEATFLKAVRLASRTGAVTLVHLVDVEALSSACFEELAGILLDPRPKARASFRVLITCQLSRAQLLPDCLVKVGRPQITSFQFSI
jgi:hypothetical protein